MRPRCERVVRGARRDRRYAQRRMATGPWAKCARREFLSKALGIPRLNSSPSFDGVGSRGRPLYGNNYIVCD